MWQPAGVLEAEETEKIEAVRGVGERAGVEGWVAALWAGGGTGQREEEGGKAGGGGGHVSSAEPTSCPHPKMERL